jgi:hypothetical protein
MFTKDQHQPSPAPFATERQPLPRHRSPIRMQLPVYGYLRDYYALPSRLVTFLLRQRPSGIPDADYQIPSARAMLPVQSLSCPQPDLGKSSRQLIPAPSCRYRACARIDGRTRTMPTMMLRQHGRQSAEPDRQLRLATRCRCTPQLHNSSMPPGLACGCTATADADQRFAANDRFVLGLSPPVNCRHTRGFLMATDSSRLFRATPRQAPDGPAPRYKARP